MKKISLKGLEQNCFYDKLDNGLEVFMFPYENKKNYFISYATRFGSDVLEFKVNGEYYKPPLGIAHFLEHKMFEQEDGIDPFTFFSKSGTDANASTSFEYTQYICSGTKNFNENLKYLINYVNSPYFTDSNVLKEKGIIAEEIKMYDDIPDFKLEMKLRQAVYKNCSRRIDIAGSVKEINKITKDDLYTCYNSFYTPNNMFILIVGNFLPEEAIDIINKELGSKKTLKLPDIKKCDEPLVVNKKNVTLKEEIEIPKLAVGIKVPTKKIKMDDLELDLYTNMLLDIVFGDSSIFRERMRIEKLLNDFYVENESIPGFRVFYLMASSLDINKLEEEIKYELSNLSISLKSFERIKKVWIANEVKMIDNINSTVSNYYDDILKYKKIIPNKIEIIRNMDIEKLNKLISLIDFNNMSIVKMINK